MHGVMEQLEDKSLLLKQYLREMETSLQQKHSHAAQLRRTCEQISNDLTVRAKEREKVEKDIELAIRKEKDEIARKLIRKRITLQTDGERLQAQLQQLQEESDRLSGVIDEQQRQYEQLKVKATAYCQQAELRTFESNSQAWAEPLGSSLISDDEVELELLRCKEAFSQGGAV